MHLKSIAALGFAATLIAFGTAPASAHANASPEAHESTVPRHDAMPSEFRRTTSCSCHRGGGGRSVSFHRFHRTSVRHVSFNHHRHHYARANVRIGGGHRATPARVQSPRLAYNNGGQSPRLTHNTRVQAPRVQSPRVAQTNRPQVRRPVQNTPRPNWRNNPLLDIRSG